MIIEALLTITMLVSGIFGIYAIGSSIANEYAEKPKRTFKSKPYFDSHLKERK